MTGSRVQSSIVTGVWAPDEEALLLELLEEGKDLRAIAVRLKRSAAAVQHHAGRLRARSALRDLRAQQQAKPEPGGTTP